MVPVANLFNFAFHNLEIQKLRFKEYEKFTPFIREGRFVNFSLIEPLENLVEAGLIGLEKAHSTQHTQLFSSLITLVFIVRH